MDSVQRQTGIVLLVLRGEGQLVTWETASKATFRVSEKPGREPESPAARSCSFSSFPVSPWSKLSGDRFGLGGISRPWKVTLPLTELLPLGSEQAARGRGCLRPSTGTCLGLVPSACQRAGLHPAKAGEGRSAGSLPAPLLRHCGRRRLNGGVPGAATPQGPRP